MSGNFDWLWKDDAPSKKAELSEGLEFSPGFTGLWHCAPMWRVWDNSGLKIEEMGLSADGVQSFPTGSFYYWKNENYEVGMKLCQAIGLKFGPKQIWRWEMHVDDSVRMTDNAKASFGPIIGYDVGISAFAGRDRIELQMIALPSAVQALAVASGVMGQAFDYRQLLKDVDELDDDWQHEMIGDDSSWPESKLWKARESIWAALGEENARAYMYNSGNKKYDTQSPILGKVLRILYEADGTDLYARVMRVPNPKVDAVNKEGKRLGVMCIDQIFKSKEAAEIAEGVEDSEDAGVQSNGNNPPLPAQWTGANERDWIEWLRDLLSENGLIDKSQKAIETAVKKMDSRLQEEFACSADEVIPWIPIVKE